MAAKFVNMRMQFINAHKFRVRPSYFGAVSRLPDDVPEAKLSFLMGNYLGKITDEKRESCIAHISDASNTFEKRAIAHFTTEGERMLAPPMQSPCVPYMCMPHLWRPTQPSPMKRPRDHHP